MKLIETAENPDFNVKVTVTVEWEHRDEDHLKNSHRAEAAGIQLQKAAYSMASALRGIQANV